MKTDYERLHFQLEHGPDGSEIWICWKYSLDNTGTIRVGTIDLNPDRNQWMLCADPLSVLTAGELREISNFMDDLNIRSVAKESK